MAKTMDPYKGIIMNIRRMSQRTALQPSAAIGKIVSPPPEIIVEHNGMKLTKEFLWIDEYWIPGHTRRMVGTTSNRGGGSGDASYESHNHPIDNDEALTDTWKVGDRVILIPILGDDNTTTVQFIVAGKLKRLDGN